MRIYKCVHDNLCKRLHTSTCTCSCRRWVQRELLNVLTVLALTTLSGNLFKWVIWLSDWKKIIRSWELQTTAVSLQALISRWEIANVNLFTTIRRRRPGAVHSVCPGVQVSTQHGTWIPVGTLPTCVRRSWSPSPTLSWSWWTGLPPVSICPRTRDGRLPTPVLHPGTRCLTISRTLIFPFNLSNVILRHSSFPHTSTPQRVWDFL